jgi:signal transduction histidine kinase
MVHQPGVVVLEEDIPAHIGDQPEIRKVLGLKRTIASIFETGTGRDYQIVLGLDKDEDVKPEIRRFLESATKRFGIGIERHDLLESLRKSQRELRELTARLIDSGEEEKRRLARILHDDVGQLMTGLRYEILALEKTLAPPSSCTRKSLEAMRVQLRLMTDSMRKLSRSLHPSMLEELGLVPTLTWYVDNFVRSDGLEVDLREVGFDRRLPHEIEVALYRIAQECLTNVARHAKASRVTIRLTKGYPRVIMNIEDNGKGISKTKGKTPTKGLGLVSMGERAQYLGGALEIKSSPGKGTRIRVEIPIEGSYGRKH